MVQAIRSPLREDEEEIHFQRLLTSIQSTISICFTSIRCYYWDDIVNKCDKGFRSDIICVHDSRFNALYGREKGQ
jgi:hypothetical protein